MAIEAIRRTVTGALAESAQALCQKISRHRQRHLRLRANHSPALCQPRPGGHLRARGRGHSPQALPQRPPHRRGVQRARARRHAESHRHGHRRRVAVRFALWRRGPGKRACPPVPAKRPKRGAPSPNNATGAARACRLPLTQNKTRQSGWPFPLWRRPLTVATSCRICRNKQNPFPPPRRNRGNSPRRRSWIPFFLLPRQSAHSAGRVPHPPP